MLIKFDLYERYWLERFLSNRVKDHHEYFKANPMPDPDGPEVDEQHQKELEVAEYMLNIINKDKELKRTNTTIIDWFDPDEIKIANIDKKPKTTITLTDDQISLFNDMLYWENDALAENGRYDGSDQSRNEELEMLHYFSHLIRPRNPIMSLWELREQRESIVQALISDELLKERKKRILILLIVLFISLVRSRYVV